MQVPSVPNHILHQFHPHAYKVSYISIYYNSFNTSFREAMVQEIIFKHSINIIQASREVNVICKMTNKKVRRRILDEEVYIGYFGENLAKYRPFNS